MLRALLLKRRAGAIALVAIVVASMMGFFMSPALAAAPPLQIQAKAAVLMDVNTGNILFEQNADQPIPPASLTKLMTLHLAWNALAAGTIHETDKVNIGSDAWAKNMPGQSLMFLEPGQSVTVKELMTGLAVDSGNDAAIALADKVGGSVPAFVAMMNAEAQKLGLKNTHFVDPAGVDPANVTTAREYVELARQYIILHPQAMVQLHSVPSFTYPQAQNLAPGHTVQDSPPITQYNLNLILGNLPGVAGVVVDGLKTGFIEQSGFNFAVTAYRDSQRLVGVILGVPGNTQEEGKALRAKQGAALMTWGFQNFAFVKPAVPATKPVRVYKGAENQVNLVPDGTVALTVENSLQSQITTTFHQESTVMAPVKKGQVLGELIYAANGKQIAKYNLVAANDVKQGGIFKRLWDSVWLTVSGWLSHFSKKK
ncbi:MAG: D-alanyl-D-alanine carboxypeptidase family protein [Mycobacterium leprae]